MEDKVKVSWFIAVMNHWSGKVPFCGIIQAFPGTSLKLVDLLPFPTDLHISLNSNILLVLETTALNKGVP